MIHVHIHCTYEISNWYRMNLAKIITDFVNNIYDENMKSRIYVDVLIRTFFQTGMHAGYSNTIDRLLFHIQ
jgi:hypothetical protein